MEAGARPPFTPQTTPTPAAGVEPPEEETRQQSATASEPPQIASGENGHGDDDDRANILARIEEQQRSLQPIGKTKVLDVPGYEGLLAIEYQYIGAEETERIANLVREETRLVHGQGSALLSSMDTLIAASKRVLIRGSVKDEWRPISDDIIPIKLDRRLAEKLHFGAGSDREVVLGLFGSEHAILQANVVLSRWMTDMTRKTDQEFL